MKNLKGNPMFIDIMSKKICIECRVEKTIDCFGKAVAVSKDGHINQCKECKSISQKNKYNLKKKYNKYKKEKKYKYDIKPSDERYAKAIYLKTIFGITLEQFNLMLKEQEESCYICGVHQSTLRKRLCVDHCHTTGQVRKLLCPKCNVAIGMFNDSSEILGKAKDYLILFGK